jgi:hypothetical protein
MKPSKLPASWKTPRARCDEYSSKLFPQLETKVVNPVEESQTTEGDTH